MRWVKADQSTRCNSKPLIDFHLCSNSSTHVHISAVFRNPTDDKAADMRFWVLFRRTKTNKCLFLLKTHLELHPNLWMWQNFLDVAGLIVRSVAHVSSMVYEDSIPLVRKAMIGWVLSLNTTGRWKKAQLFQLLCEILDRIRWNLQDDSQNVVNKIGIFYFCTFITLKVVFSTSRLILLNIRFWWSAQDLVSGIIIAVLFGNISLPSSCWSLFCFHGDIKIAILKHLNSHLSRYSEHPYRSHSQADAQSPELPLWRLFSCVEVSGSALLREPRNSHSLSGCSMLTTIMIINRA